MLTLYLILKFGVGLVVCEEVRLAVMIPLCSRAVSNMNATVTRAMEDAHQRFDTQMLSFTYDVIDSCSEVDAINSVVSIFHEDHYGALIGPGNAPVCETAARLASHVQRSMTSWLCVNDALSDKNVYTTLSRSVPSNRNTAQALTEILTLYKWKYVMIMYVTEQPYWEMASDVHLHLARRDFDVTEYERLSDEDTADDITKVFLKMSQDTRGRLCTFYSTPSQSRLLRSII